MIHCEMTKTTQVKGNMLEILTELTLVVKTIHKHLSGKFGKEQADEFIQWCVSLAKCSEAELEQHVKDMISKISGGGI